MSWLCNYCKKEKESSSFYACRINKCKECVKKSVSFNREANHDKVKAYDRARSKTPKRLEQRNSNCKKFRFENPEKYKAHSLVSSAIRCRRLSKLPCSICGAEGRNVHAHHDDYSKPLDVVWLCSQHHHDRHKELRAMNKDPDSKEA